MSREISKNKLQNTLGFFLHGIPAVFVRNDIAFLANPRLQRYMEYYRNVENGLETNDDFSKKAEILAGYELAVTPVHELRHFHDALLSYPLFELFILKAKENLYVLQLGHHITNLMENELPISIEALQNKVTASGKHLLKHLSNTEKVFNQRFNKLFSKYDFNGSKISVSYLLEANAIIAELCTLIMDHGIDAAMHYYRKVVVNLQPEYHLLLDHFLKRHNKLEIAMGLLHYWVSYCLYFFDNPVEKFIALYNDFRLAENSPVSNETMAKTFSEREDALVNRIKNICLTNEAGTRIESSKIPSSFDDYFILPKQMYALRSNLIDKYIHTFQFNLYSYLEKTNELPIPPVVFFPSESEIREGKVSSVQDSDLRKANKPYYTIAGQEDDNGSFKLIAGITSLLGLNSSISFVIVDMMLVAQYIYHYFFQSTDVLYNEVIDYMYKNILRKSYLH